MQVSLFKAAAADSASEPSNSSLAISYADTQTPPPPPYLLEAEDIPEGAQSSACDPPQ